MSLDLHALRDTNAVRSARWLSGDPWSGADKSNEMMGEAGEAANVVKKIRRIETNTPGADPAALPALLDHLASELADVVITADLLATFYGIDLAAATVAKFNATSIKMGFPERLDSA